MKVIEIDGTIAIVADTTALSDAGIPFKEVDQEDSNRIVSGNPKNQSDLQHIFQSVMAMFGLHVRAPEPAQPTIES